MHFMSTPFGSSRSPKLKPSRDKIDDSKLLEHKAGGFLEFDVGWIFIEVIHSVLIVLKFHDEAMCQAILRKTNLSEGSTGG